MIVRARGRRRAALPCP